MSSLIVTRGMGGDSTSNALITRGYTLLEEVLRAIEEVPRIIHGGSSSKKRYQEKEIIVGVKLRSVNGEKLDKQIEGYVRMNVDSTKDFRVEMIKHVKSVIGERWRDIKIDVKRVK